MIQREMPCQCNNTRLNQGQKLFAEPFCIDLLFVVMLGSNRMKALVFVQGIECILIVPLFGNLAVKKVVRGKRYCSEKAFLIGSKTEIFYQEFSRLSSRFKLLKPMYYVDMIFFSFQLDLFWLSIITLVLFFTFSYYFSKNIELNEGVPISIIVLSCDGATSAREI